MIFGILEFCINAYNGPYHTTPAILLSPSAGGLRYALPYTALYIAYFGMITPMLSFVLVHHFMLFGIIHAIYESLCKIVYSGNVDSPLGRALFSPVVNCYAISLIVSFTLYTFYQLSLRRSCSIVGRMSHACVFLFVQVLFRKATIILLANFCLNKLLMFGFKRIYLLNKSFFQTFTFSFVGVFYFLKLFPLWDFLGMAASPSDNFFNFVIWQKSNTWNRILLSYSFFFVLFMSAFTFQNALLTSRMKGRS